MQTAARPDNDHDLFGRRFLVLNRKRPGPLIILVGPARAVEPACTVPYQLQCCRETPSGVPVKRRGPPPAG
jgi:hypothetical protein